MKGSNEDYSNFVLFSRSKFLNSARKKNGRFNNSYKSGGGVRKLFKELSYPYDPYHYSLKHHHLGIDKEFAASYLIYDRLAIKAWKMQIQTLFKPPYFFKFEVGELDSRGNLGLMHVHLIADVDAGLLRISRNGEVVKPITSFADFRRRIKYLYKPVVAGCSKARKEYIEALLRIEEENKRLPKSKKRRQVPQISGFVWD